MWRPGIVQRGVNTLLTFESSLKRHLKPLLFRDEVAPRRIRFGVGRGLVLLLNRRHEVQKELGLWQIEAQAIYRRWVRRGTTVFDVGAGEGHSALLLARLAAPARTVVFEPNPALRARLPHNVLLNPGLPKPLILPWSAGARDNGKGTVTLDGVVADGIVPPPQFVNVDVHGAELEVLRGMRQVLATHRPVLFVDVSRVEREGECMAFLTPRGYAVRVVKKAWWHRSMGAARWLLAVPEESAA